MVIKVRYHRLNGFMQPQDRVAPGNRISRAFVALNFFKVIQRPVERIMLLAFSKPRLAEAVGVKAVKGDIFAP